MNVYIWEQISHASSAYHSEGGVVVIAEDEATAREAANAKQGCSITSAEVPDYVVPVSGNYTGGVHVFIFPDAGCC